MQTITDVYRALRASASSTANALDFDDLLVKTYELLVSRTPPACCDDYQPTASATSWWTSTRTPTACSTRSSTLLAAEDEQPHASWATTTSPSTAGAARTSATSSTSRQDYPNCPHGKAGAELPLHQPHPRARPTPSSRTTRRRKSKRLLHRRGTTGEKITGLPGLPDERERGPLDRRRDRAPARRRACSYDDMAVFYRTNAQSPHARKTCSCAPACRTASSAARASSTARRSATSWPTSRPSCNPDDDVAAAARHQRRRAAASAAPPLPRFRSLRPTRASRSSPPASRASARPACSRPRCVGARRLHRRHRGRPPLRGRAGQGGRGHRRQGRPHPGPRG